MISKNIAKFQGEREKKFLPLVSVITPSYNQGEFIEETILSVKNQNYPNIEHIIVDGGSTDNTLKILKKYDKTYRLWWISESDEGQADAVNKGLDKANGEIIGWLNSDDVYFDKSSIRNVVEAFQKNLKADVLYGHIAYIDEDGRILRIQCVPRFSFSRLVRGCFLEQPGVFFRKRVADRERLNVQLQYAMDYEFWLRLARVYRFYRLNNLVASDRNHPARKMITQFQRMRSEANQIRKRYSMHNTVGQRFVRYWDRYILGPPRRLHGLVLLLGLYQRINSLAFAGYLGTIASSLLSQLSPKGIVRPERYETYPK